MPPRPQASEATQAREDSPPDQSSTGQLVESGASTANATSEQGGFPRIESFTLAEAEDDPEHRTDLKEPEGNGARTDPETGVVRGVEFVPLPDKPADAGPMWLQLAPGETAPTG